MRNHYLMKGLGLMWVDQLINEYTEGRKELIETREKLTDSEIDNLDKRQVNGMIRDMTFSLSWLKIGREPGALRGIDRRSAYQRRVLMDMDLFPSLEIQPDQEEISNEDKKAIIDILIDLSVRERQSYVLHNAYEMSMADIADELGISKSAVQTFLERANRKINNKIVSYGCHTVAN